MKHRSALTISHFVAALIAGSLFFMAGCGEPTQVANEAEPRIAAIGPGVGVILRDLGLDDRVVGRHGFDMALDPDLPVCGDLMGIDYEALLAVNPTHVYLEWDQRESPLRLQELAALRGWKVQLLRLTSLEGIRACTADIAQTFAVETDLMKQMDRAWASQPGRFNGAGRVLLLVQTNPPAALGPGSYHHDILERIGGKGALQDAAPFVTMDVEDVIRLNPDAIVIVAPRPRDTEVVDHSTEQIAGMLGPLTGRGIAAIEHCRVAVIDDPLCQTASTALIGFADELAEILARWSGEASEDASKDMDSAYTGGDD